MKLRTGTAFILMVCLIVFSVGFGAYRGFSRDRAEVEKAYAGLQELVTSPNARLEEILAPRIEAANALLTVARRHLPDTDEAVQALVQDRDTLAGMTSLAEKSQANSRFNRHAEALMDLLAGQDSVLADARDLAYVAQPGYLRTLLKNSEAQANEDQFAQAVAAFTDAVEEYNRAADDFNGEIMGSFSGWVARLLGVSTVESFSDPTQIRFSVPGQPRYPQKPEGHVTDRTLMGVLDEKTAADLETLAQRLQKASGGSLYVAAVDFLNKANPDEYAKTLFDQWGLGTRDALLLMAVGENTRTLIAGSAAAKTLDQITLERLFSRHFDALYQSLQYSQAAADLARAAAQTLAPGVLDTAGLFSSFSAAEPAPTAPPQENAGTGASIVTSVVESVHQMAESKASSRRFNWRSILIWGLVIYFLFFRKKNRKRR